MMGNNHVPGWDGTVVPKNIGELYNWFRDKYHTFLDIDVMIQTKQRQEPELSFTTCGQSPAKIRSKLDHGRWSLSNVHCWLEFHGHGDKPSLISDADDLLILEIEMGQMEVWLWRNEGVSADGRIEEPQRTR